MLNIIVKINKDRTYELLSTERLNKNELNKYDLLVIANSYERIKHPFEKRALAFNYILTRFNQIIVNK